MPLVKRTRAVAWTLAVAFTVGACRGSASSASSTSAPAPVEASPKRDRLSGVVDPWSWPRARGATDRERAIEDIGPYESTPRVGPNARVVNTNAYQWTELVGLAWTRDVNLDFDHVPVDLDADGMPDTEVTRHIHAPGGILANPEIFGLTTTPDDPRGKVGRISISTGILGLREALTPDGKPSGQIGMTCFLCHGASWPRDTANAASADKASPRLGLPGTRFDYGLLLATAAALDENNAPAAAHRRARGFPPGRTVQARLLMAGPGRQDLTGEFGLDITIPNLHSRAYAGTSRVRQGTTGIVNPISVPGTWGTAGLNLQNWSGSEVASLTWLRRVVELSSAAATTKTTATVALGALELPSAKIDDFDDYAETAPVRRALLLDLRNLGTLGLQHDSFPALLWADAVYGRESLSADDLARIPKLYAAPALRRITEQESESWRRAVEPTTPEQQKSIERGRAIFSERIVGTVANLQIFKQIPRRYLAAKQVGPALAPIDETLPARFNVRCADCHSATPGGPRVSLDVQSPPFGRCGHCHRSHAAFDDAPPARPTETGGDDAPRFSLAALGVPSTAREEVARCRTCHDVHRAFSPTAWSNSVLLPFDANQNGKAQDDEGADARAGGIGTEALLAFDVPKPQRGPDGFSLDVLRLSSLFRTTPIRSTRIGAGWVRVAPLLALRASAPFLHNGSVPTLRDLLEPAQRRPVTFSLGQAGFRFDTRLPGNHNRGHEFGTALSASEKRDLIAFLQTL